MLPYPTLHIIQFYNCSPDVYIGEKSSTRVLASALPQHIIQNLDPENNYGIWVQALSLSREGPKSVMLIGGPTNNGTYSMLTLNK